MHKNTSVSHFETTWISFSLFSLSACPYNDLSLGQLAITHLSISIFLCICFFWSCFPVHKDQQASHLSVLALKPFIKEIMSHRLT